MISLDWGYYWTLSGWHQWHQCLWGAPRYTPMNPDAPWCTPMHPDAAWCSLMHPLHPDWGSDEGWYTTPPIFKNGQIVLDILACQRLFGDNGILSSMECERIEQKNPLHILLEPVWTKYLPLLSSNSQLASYQCHYNASFSWLQGHREWLCSDHYLLFRYGKL